MNKQTMQDIDTLLEASPDNLSPESFQELQQVLRKDPAALAYYCQQAEIHGRLEWELGNPENKSATVNTPSTQSLAAKQSNKKLFHQPQLWMGIAAALALLLAAHLFVTITSKQEKTTSNQNSSLASTDSLSPEINQNAPVARITNTKSANWKKASLTEGDWLTPQKLHLISGTAEITMDCGARIILQGPAHLELNHAHHAHLTSGKATTHVPLQAIGFELSTPSTNFTDENCSFSVAVSQDGSTEIHVIRGLVEATPKANPQLAKVLHRQDSLRLTQSAFLSPDKLRHNSRSFTRKLPSSPQAPIQYLHFPLNKASNGITPDTGKHYGSPFPARILARPGTSKFASADFTNGKFGKAIRLNGRGAFLSSAFPGIAGSAPRTIAFWVKIAPDTPKKHAYSMLAWGKPQSQQGKKWQISWNPAGDNSGVKGAIRTEFGGGYVIGSTDLRDGRWHHVAVVFLGGKSVDVSTHLRHYIDGRLEKVSAVKSNRIDTLLSSKESRPTFIGRRLEEDIPGSSFKGTLDEIYIFPAALTPRQILNLCSTNTAP